jgi:hypothetical protein
MYRDVSEDEYHRLVEALRKKSADDFRASRQRGEDILLPLKRYFDHGTSADFSLAELIDHLGISTPSILELAGFPDAEAQAAMDSLPRLDDQDDDRPK